jgi:hypothetical protein
MKRCVLEVITAVKNQQQNKLTRKFEDYEILQVLHTLIHIF